MSSKFNAGDLITVPCILFFKNDAIYVSDHFLNLTGYTKEEVLRNNIEYILKNLLRLNSDIEMLEQRTKSFFIFSKNFEPREVEIDYSLTDVPNQKVYIFNEKPFSRIEDKFKTVEQLCTDNLLSVSIYSVPDLILLKASQKYLDFFDPPYNTRESCIGRCIYDFVSGWRNSSSESIWRNVISTSRSAVVKEQKHIGFERGVTYWDAIIMPISEDGKVKFITSQTTDVTERVVSRNMAEEHAKALEEKSSELQAVVDSISDDLYIIEKDGTIKTVNSNARTVFKNRAVNIYENYKVSKYYDLYGTEIPFEKMPSARILMGEKIKDEALHIKRNSNERYVSVSGTPLFDQYGSVKRAVYCHNDISKYIQQSKVITQQKDQLEAIIENLTDGLFMLDRDHNFTFLNEAGKEFFYQSETIKKNGDSFKSTKYYDMEGNEIPIEEMVGSRVLRGEVIKQFQIKVVRPDKTIYYSLSGSPVYDSDDNLSYAVVCCRDMTEQIQNEQNLRQKSQQLEAIIQSIDDAIFIYDANKKYYLTNKAAKDYYKNIKLDTFEKVYDFYRYYDLNGNEVPLENMTISKVFRGEAILDNRLTLKNGETIKHISVNGRPIFDKQGNIEFAVLCSRDITKDIEVQRLVESHKSQLDALLENMVEGVVIADIEGNILRMNVAALKIHCLSSLDEPVFIKEFTSNYELTDLDGEIIPIEEWPISRAICEETFIDREVWVHNKAMNTKSICSYNGTPIYNKDGQMIMAIVTIRDITEQKQQQQALLKAVQERNEALENSIRMKDEFLSLVSHEFKTPLTVINSAIQAMELICKDDLSDKAKSFIKKIRQNSFRQLRLVNNLLDITRANAGKIKINKKNLDIVFITKAITESVCLYAFNKGVELTFSSSINYKVIGIDDEKYERVLLNLLSNAIKFTPSGKSIKVTLRSKKGSICVEVKDSGIGIPKDKQELIFERFGQVDSSLTRQAEGTGIGLSLVKMLVEAMGGDITLKSRGGKGSSFTVLLPAVRAKEKDAGSETKEISGDRLVLATNIEFSDIYIEEGLKQEKMEISVNEKKVQDLLERESTAKAICSELNKFSDLKLTLVSILSNLKELTGCEAVGIRLHEDDDYPYYVYEGFPECFIKLENSLCEKDLDGNRRRSKDGNYYILQCVCGKVIRGNTDSNLSFFTDKGSYWTNHASELKSRPNIDVELGDLRGNCIVNGYESTALVPIKSKANIIGLIHLNDTRLNMFTEDLIEFLEMLGEQIGSAVENSLLQEKLSTTKL